MYTLYSAINNFKGCCLKHCQRLRVKLYLLGTSNKAHFDDGYILSISLILNLAEYSQELTSIREIEMSQ